MKFVYFVIIGFLFLVVGCIEQISEQPEGTITVTEFKENKSKFLHDFYESCELPGLSPDKCHRLGDSKEIFETVRSKKEELNLPEVFGKLEFLQGVACKCFTVSDENSSIEVYYNYFEDEMKNFNSGEWVIITPCNAKKSSAKIGGREVLTAEILSIKKVN